ncbi:MAG: hypothetical protein UY72_C0077G0011 [Candidatus Uhrbacteria bacterium GW2011_GWD2_52_7]|uniref:Uncharacterized protein n=1 Tax=Candidatus Uhrbacteria bacterium GW2011_GWD2_52_7 TaxID=1618989 RepID=A0A0G1ZJT6_9BACT|nr:MAG: hypothetical protein UY72_C0077G0011 [Candidatus Uhrbacteria bacterium GW2011_GWD2_52_7]
MFDNVPEDFDCWDGWHHLSTHPGDKPDKPERLALERIYASATWCEQRSLTGRIDTASREVGRFDKELASLFDITEEVGSYDYGEPSVVGIGKLTDGRYIVMVDEDVGHAIVVHRFIVVEADHPGLALLKERWNGRSPSYAAEIRRLQEAGMDGEMQFIAQRPIPKPKE